MVGKDENIESDKSLGALIKHSGKRTTATQATFLYLFLHFLRGGNKLEDLFRNHLWFLIRYKVSSVFNEEERAIFAVGERVVGQLYPYGCVKYTPQN